MPAYAVLLITGIWNVLATRDEQRSAWKVVLGVKIAVVVLAGIAAYGLATWGAVTALASAGVLVLGVLLAAEHSVRVPGWVRPHPWHRELAYLQGTFDRQAQSVVLLPRGTLAVTRRVERLGADEGGHMSKYFVQVGYTAEAWAAMSRGPQRVVERVQASAEALGGSIESLYFCFGDYDLMGVVEFPDSRGVAAWSMAVSSGGDVRDVYKRQQVGRDRDIELD